MGGRIRARNVLSRVLFILVFAASLGVFYLTRTGEGYMDFIINLIFAAVAATVLMVYFVGCARPLSRMALALDRVTESILASADDAKTLWSRYSQDPTPFGESRLDERWGAYLRELRRMQKQNSLTADCRIEDYIDEELLYSAVNKPFADQVGGIMSGLGILFTFIGLVYGLRNFDASTVDVMQTSTQALMSGIKIAFLTSIFGLIYSLLFGVFYKRLVKDSVDALYAFQDTFTEEVRPTNEHAAENAMLRLQMEQNAALQTFGTNVGDQVSEAIVRLVQPTVDTLRDTITQYVSVAIEDQRAGMERVVRYFLDSMNTSLGGIFVQLRSRTEELTRWEKDTIESISAMTASFGSTGRSLGEAEVQARKIADTMEQFTTAAARLTEAQRAVTEQLESVMSDYRAVHEREEEYLRELGAAASAAQSHTRESLAAAQSVAAIAADIRAANSEGTRAISDAGAEVAASAEAVRAMSQAVTEDIGTAAGKLERAVGELEGGLARSMADSIALMDDSISRLTSCMGAVTSASNNVTSALKSVPRTVSGVESSVRDTSKVIDSELKLLLKAVSDAQKSLTRFSAELERRTEL